MAYYHCLLLDVDGTLLDFDAAEEAALQNTLQHFELPCDSETIAAYHEINNGLWRAMERGEVKKDKLVLQRFAKLLEQIGREGDAAAINDYYLSRLAENAPAYPGIAELLAQLGEVATLAVVSNGVERVQQGRLRLSGLDKLLDEVFVSEKLGVAKPNRKFFEIALNTLGIINRKKVLVVGDSLKADIQGGISAGLATCWCNYKQEENTTGIKPTYTITSPQELLQIVMEEEELSNVGNPSKRHLV